MQNTEHHEVDDIAVGITVVTPSTDMTVKPRPVNSAWMHTELALRTGTGIPAVRSCRHDAGDQARNQQTFNFMAIFRGAQ